MIKYILLTLFFSSYLFCAERDCVDGALRQIISPKRKAEYARQWSRLRSLQVEQSKVSNKIDVMIAQQKKFLNENPKFEITQRLERYNGQIKLKEIRLGLADSKNKPVIQKEIDDLKKEYANLEQEWRTFQTFGEFNDQTMREYNRIQLELDKLKDKFEDLGRQISEQHRMLTE